MATRLGRTVATAKIERGLGTERARLGTFRGLGTERARLGPFKMLALIFCGILFK